MAKKHGGGSGGGHDTIKKQRLAAEYGFALAFMKSDPELWHLFNQAVKKTWDANMFVARLRATKWFKHHSAAARNAIMQRTSDPATWQANVDKMQSTVRDEWGKLFGEGTIDDKQLARWAKTAQTLGWSEGELIDHMSKGLNYQKLLQNKNLGGTAAETEAQLDQLISEYGVDLGNKWKAGQVRDIIDGGGTIGGIQDQVREMAKQQYAAFADQLDAGKTMSEIADPYVQKMSDLLELDPNAVGVKNDIIQKALTQRTKDGKPAAMNMSDFANMVRQDHRWQYTDNAKTQVANVTSNLLRSFGLMA